MNMFLNTLNSFSADSLWERIAGTNATLGQGLNIGILARLPGKRGSSHHPVSWILHSSSSCKKLPTKKAIQTARFDSGGQMLRLAPPMLPQQVTPRVCQATCASFGHCSGCHQKLAANAQQCCSSFKIAVCLWGGGGKKCGIGKSLSLLRQPVSRKIAAYFLREEHMLILPSHPQGRLKGM